MIQPFLELEALVWQYFSSPKSKLLARSYKIQETGVGGRGGSACDELVSDVGGTATPLVTIYFWNIDLKTIAGLFLLNASLRSKWYCVFAPFCIQAKWLYHEATRNISAPPLYRDERTNHEATRCLTWSSKTEQNRPYCYFFPKTKMSIQKDKIKKAFQLITQWCNCYWHDIVRLNAITSSARVQLVSLWRRICNDQCLASVKEVAVLVPCYCGLRTTSGSTVQNEFLSRDLSSNRR